MTTPVQDPVRVERRRREHERQAVVFGLLIAFLSVVGLGALAVYTGAIEAPLPKISDPAAEEDPAPTAPCLPAVEGQPDGALPVPYAEIQLRILNASPTTGLAAAHRDVLRDRGFEVVEMGNLDHRITHSELRFGVQGITRAYTLSAQFPEMRLVLDDREDAVVDLLVGEEYDKPLAEDQVALLADRPMANMPGCLPAEEITPVPQEVAAGAEG